MAIITVSRELGSLGNEAAETLAKRLGYKLVDKELLDKALAGRGIAERKIEKYDEKRPSVWDAFSSDRDRYLHFLKAVIYEEASKGDTVIIGRGGCILLGELPGTLHVRVTAPHDVRVRRMAAQLKIKEHQAEQVLKHSDHDRAGFWRYFFNVNWADSSIYDLVINTAHIDDQIVADLIERALEPFSVEKHEKAARSLLADLALGQQVETRILYEQSVPVQFLEARVSDGVVTLLGAVSALKNAEKAVEIAKGVPGVREVRNEISFISYYGMMT